MREWEIQEIELERDERSFLHNCETTVGTLTNDTGDAKDEIFKLE